MSSSEKETCLLTLNVNTGEVRKMVGSEVEIKTHLASSLSAPHRISASELKRYELNVQCYHCQSLKSYPDLDYLCMCYDRMSPNYRGICSACSENIWKKFGPPPANCVLPDGHNLKITEKGMVAHKSYSGWMWWRDVIYPCTSTVLVWFLWGCISEGYIAGAFLICVVLWFLA